MASEANPRQDLIDLIAEEVAERWRQGERPTAEEYAARYPEAADEIREVFPTLVLMEDLGSLSDARAQGPPADLAIGKDGQFGDYRILREIGRGGMGVVFEAEQLSLGRRVALKVLPQRGSLSGRQIERFQLEARSAARLLHPHIVAIHDVGVEGGVHYYAMQYVAGQSLDAVIRELWRVRNDDRAALERANRGGDVLDSRRIAIDLLDGSFTASSMGARVPPDGLEDLPPARRPGAAGSSSAIQLPGGDSSTAMRDGTQHYFRSVAVIGTQVADALAYAHERGILHRDIKPSNLLLDLKASVWVTDFGLAKAQDSEALTLSGDVVGTLRYMGPERFRGWSGAESDVYALGGTLYELLTLRPLFITTDRAALIREILHDGPIAPRRVDPRIPLDLETIVLKAIEKDPAHRYASAAALRDDLLRFIEGRPVVARRTPLSERAWLWCRRNRTVASLATAIAVMLLAAAVTASVMAVRLKENAESLKGERNAAVENLWHARLAQARAGRWSLVPGQRRASLEALTAAAATRVDQELRNEAAAALCLPDVAIVETREWSQDTCISPDFELCARKEGAAIRVSRRRDGEIIAEIPGSMGSFQGFSPDGKLLALRYMSGEGAVWRIHGPERVATMPMGWVSSFSADSRFIAFLTSAAARVFDVQEKSWTQRFGELKKYSRIDFAPSGYLAACTRSNMRDVDIVDLESGETRRTLRHSAAVSASGWSGDGRLLATAGRDMTAYVWDAEAGSLIFPLGGHHSSVVSVTFQPRGSLLATYSWDGHTRLWDVRSGRIVAICEGSWLGFDRDGKRLAYGFGEEMGIAEVVQGGEYSCIRTRDPGVAAGPHYADISPCGRWIASSHGLGLRLWNRVSGRLAALAPIGSTVGVRFLPDGSILTTGEAGLLLWPLEVEGPTPAGATWRRLGPPEVLWDRAPLTRNVSVSADGKLAAFHSANVPYTVRLQPPYEARSYPPRPALFDLQISPDGRWIGGSNWNASGVPIWSVETAERPTVLPAEGSAQAVFSPDSKRVLVGSGAEYQAFETGTWTPALTVKRGRGRGTLGNAVFSATGKIMVLQQTRSLLRLVDARDGSEILTLASPGEAVLPNLALSRDGGLLVATSGNDQAMHVWDLRKLADGFDRLGIDARIREALEPSPPAPVDAAARIEVDLGLLAPARRRERELLRLGKRIEQNPRDTGLLLQRSRIQLELGSFEAALADQKQALEIAPGNARLLNSLAWLHVLLPEGVRDIERAIACSEEALRIEKGSFDFLNTLGALQYRAGRYPAAIATLEACRKAPVGGTAFDDLFLSMAYSRLGRRDVARAAFDRALDWIAGEEAGGRITSAMRFELEIFRREAEALLEPAPPGQPPAPAQASAAPTPPDAR